MTMQGVLFFAVSVFALACSNSAPAGGYENTIFETQDKKTKFRVETVATGLEVPWAFAWLPNKDLIFTERKGRVRIIESGKLRAEPIFTVPDGMMRLCWFIISRTFSGEMPLARRARGSRSAIRP